MALCDLDNTLECECIRCLKLLGVWACRIVNFQNGIGIVSQLTHWSWILLTIMLKKRKTPCLVGKMVPICPQSHFWISHASPSFWSADRLPGACGETDGIRRNIFPGGELAISQSKMKMMCKKGNFLVSYSITNMMCMKMLSMFSIFHHIPMKACNLGIQIGKCGGRWMRCALRSRKCDCYIL